MPDGHGSDPTSLNDGALQGLTSREKECLALVAAGLESKEIAPLLGIESGSVDQALKRAGRRVGVAGRKRLARLFAEQQPEVYQSLIQRLGRAQKALVPPSDSPPDGIVASIAERGPPSQTRWPLPTEERQWNDLPPWKRRAWAVAIALGLATAILLLVSFSQNTLVRLPTFNSP